MIRRMPRGARLAVTLSLIAFSTLGWAGVPPSPDSGLCKALPLDAIEAFLGAEPGRIGGRDLEDYQSCSASFGDAAVKVEHQTPGRPGLPGDVPSGLRGLLAAFGSNIRGVETREFGDIGCYRGVLEVMGTSTQTAACFQPKGFYVFGVTRPGSEIPMERVRDLLEKTIERREQI